MPRQPRVFSPDIAYHVIARGNNRQILFKKDTDFHHFLTEATALKLDYACEIFHYCLMSNHVHLLIRFPNLISFQKFPQRLFLRYAKYFARTYMHVGHVFQDRFKSLAVKDNAYLLECGRYIDRNPLVAHMVSDLTAYKWSSASFYLEGTANELITVNPMYLDLSDQPPIRRQLYRKFVTTPRAYEDVVETTLFGRGLASVKVST